MNPDPRLTRRKTYRCKCLFETYKNIDEMYTFHGDQEEKINRSPDNPKMIQADEMIKNKEILKKLVFE